MGELGLRVCRQSSKRCRTASNVESTIGVADGLLLLIDCPAGALAPTGRQYQNRYRFFSGQEVESLAATDVHFYIADRRRDNVKDSIIRVVPLNFRDELQ